SNANIDDQIAAFDKAARRQVGQYDGTDSVLISECEHAHAPNPFRSVCIFRRNCYQHRANEQNTSHFNSPLPALLAPYHSPPYEECRLWVQKRTSRNVSNRIGTYEVLRPSKTSAQKTIL